MTNNQLDRSQDSHTYRYDSAQRFTKMERGTIGGTPNFYQGYTLDVLANWSSFNNNGTTESRSHDVMNAIIARGATSLSHDLNGNLTNDGNQKYIWDELNRLVEVRDSGNNIICDYYYNADNLRVEKHHAGGAKEQFYYDGATVLVETDGSQTKVREYVNGGQYIDEVILVVNGSNYNYYMSDLRYCVTGFIDSTGAVVERARYDGYGKRTLLDASYATIAIANVDQSYGYTGIRHDDESGLQYYRARYFDNTLGRFINRDPIGYLDGMNLYSGYFIVNSLDPSGLKSEECCKEEKKKWEEAKIKREIEELKFDQELAKVGAADNLLKTAIKDKEEQYETNRGLAADVLALDNQINNILQQMNNATSGVPDGTQVAGFGLLGAAGSRMVGGTTKSTLVATATALFAGAATTASEVSTLNSTMSVLSNQLANANAQRDAKLPALEGGFKKYEELKIAVTDAEKALNAAIKKARIQSTVLENALTAERRAKDAYNDCLEE